MPASARRNNCSAIHSDRSLSYRNMMNAYSQVRGYYDGAPVQVFDAQYILIALVMERQLVRVWRFALEGIIWIAAKFAVLDFDDNKQ